MWRQPNRKSSLTGYTNPHRIRKGIVASSEMTMSSFVRLCSDFMPESFIQAIVSEDVE